MNPRHSLRAFLCGKMHVDDVPLVKELMREGLIVGPTFVPAWYRAAAVAQAVAPGLVARFANRFGYRSAR